MEERKTDDMNISELARHTGASVRSLRYYEARRLLSPQRGENGYRFYDATTIERVKTIQCYLRLGLTTHEIFDIVFCRNPGDVASLCTEINLFACPGTVDFYRRKLAEIEAQITSLEKAKTFLEQSLAGMYETVSG